VFSCRRSCDHFMPNPFDSFFLPWRARGLVRRAQPQSPPPPPPRPCPSIILRLLIADTEAKAIACRDIDAGPSWCRLRCSLQRIGDAVATYSASPSRMTCPSARQRHSRLSAKARRLVRVSSCRLQNQHIDVGNPLAVLIGRYKQLRFQGNRWFSRQCSRRNSGQTRRRVRVSTLEEATNWAHHPFRRIKVRE